MKKSSFFGFAAFFCGAIAAFVLASGCFSTPGEDGSDEAVGAAELANIWSSDGRVNLLAPHSNEQIMGAMTAVGMARAPGDTIHFRLRHENGSVLTSGSVNTRPAQAGGSGPFNIWISLANISGGKATFEVFLMDGQTERSWASVPLWLSPADNEWASLPLHRLYHEGFGTHLYTPYDWERDDGINNRYFISEGTQGRVYRYGGNGRSAIYHLRHTNAEVNNHDRFYTLNWEEAVRAVNEFGYELYGTAGYAMWSEGPNLQPWYRLYDSTNRVHHYTISPDERSIVLGRGWLDEGIAAWLPTQ